MINQSEFITSLKSVINYHRVCGVTGYHVEGNILATLDKIARRPADEDRSVPERPQAARGREPEEKSGGQKPQKCGVLDMVSLRSEIEACNKCLLHRNRQVSTPGKGGTNPLLLIVGDWLTVAPGRDPAADALFGQGQDSMLSKMISAIGLVESEVYITNVIKCSIPDNCQPMLEHVSACSKYLLDQIEILSPRVICTMGIIAARLLTGRSQPLSLQRGHFFQYKTSSGKEIPLMPTYHPTFLLQNHEMKKETWADLQDIQKKINQAR